MKQTAVRLMCVFVLMWLGTPVSGRAQGDVIFQDDFSDNSNSWWEGSNQDYLFKVEYGAYVFDNYSDKTYTIAKGAGLLADDAFSFEASIRKVSGITNNIYGVVWGYQDADNCYAFGLSGDGSYLYGKWAAGSWVTLTDWTSSSYINKFTSYAVTNKIRVERVGTRVSFYINDYFVNSAVWEAPKGNQIGFVVTKRQRVEIDKIVVKKTGGSGIYTGGYSGTSGYGSGGGGGSFSASVTKTLSYDLSGDYNRGGAITSDGSKFAVGGANGGLRVYQTSDGSVYKTLYGHSNWVNGLAFSPDGMKLASASSDKSVKIWDVNGGYALKTFSDFQSDVIAVAFSSDGKFVAAGGFDNSIKIYDVQGGYALRTLTGHSDHVWSLQFSPDGRYLLSGDASGTIKVWNAGTWYEEKSAFQSGWITSIRFTSDGQKAVTTSYGNTVRVWSFPGMYELKTMSHTDNVWMSAISPDNRFVASGGADNVIRVWDVNTGNSVQTLYGHSKNVGVVLFASSGKSLVTASDDNTIKLWSVSGVSTASLYGGALGDDRRSGTFEGGAFNATLSNTVNYMLSGDYNRGGAVSPDGQKFVVGGAKGDLKIYRTSDGSTDKTLYGHTSYVNGLAFSADGTKLASGSSDKSMKIWDVNGGYALRTFSDFPEDVIAVAFSPDGKYVAAGGFGQTLRIYDVSGGYLIKTLYGHPDNIWSVQFSPDGKYLISGDSDGNIKVWSTSTWLQEKTAFQSGWITSIRFSSDGTRAVTTSYGNTVKVWSFPGMYELKSFSHTSNVWMASISPDDKYVASGGADNVVRVWDIVSGQSVQTLYGHTKNIGVVLFTSDGKKLITASDDNTIKLWSVSGVGARGSGTTTTSGGYSGAGRTLTVARDGTGQYATVAAAIAAAGSGDIIQVKKGTYFENTLSITKENVKLTGEDPQQTIIDGSAKYYILEIKANGVTVSGLTFKNSTGSAGAVQIRQSDATFTNNIVRDNSNYGIYIWGGTPTISNCTFYNNCGGTYSQEQDVIAMNASSAIVKNNVMYANNGGSAIDNEYNSFPSISYNIIFNSGQAFKRCYGGTGNLFLDPMLSTSDFTLRVGSPAIGKGEGGATMGVLSSVTSGGTTWTGRTEYSGAVDATFSKKLAGHANKVRALDISPDGKYVASGDGSGTIILWDALSGSKVRTLSGHTSWVNGLDFSPDGQMLVSGSSDKTVIIWDVSTGRQLKVLSGHTDLVVPVQFSPNGRYVASGSFDNTVKIWDVQSGSMLRTLSGHQSSLWGMAFSTDGNLLATGDTGDEIILWNTTSWSQVRKMKSGSSSNWVDGLVFSTDNKKLFAGGYNNNIVVWDVATGTQLKTLYGHTNHIWSVALSPDGKVLATVSSDRTVKLWDVASGSLIKTLGDATDEVFGIAFSTDGTKLAASSDDHFVYMWNTKGISGSRVELTTVVQTLPPFLVASATFTDNTADNLLQAGESGKVTLTIRNTGKGPALGVNARFTLIEGSLGLFVGNPTYFVGDIPAGQERTVTTTVDASEDVITQKVKLRVEGTEKNGFGADAVILQFSTKAMEPPLLAVNKYVLRDDNTGQSQGNGDGVIQKKETIEMTVFVANSGLGPAADVKLSLKSTDPNIVISQGTATVGEVKPGEIKKGVFVFAVSGNYNQETPNLPISLDISEKRPKFNKLENLNLSLGTDYKKEVVVDVVSTVKHEDKSTLLSQVRDKVAQAISDMNLKIKGESTMADVELPARENVYAVVIGISDYKNKDVPPLTYAVNDASSFYALLTNNVIGGVPRENVKLLTGPEATLTEIKVSLGWLVNQGMEDEDAVLLFYYSGHGAPEQDDQGNVKTAFLIPYDGQPKFLAETGIGLDYLQQEMGKVKAKNVFVAMDACFTGSGRSFMKTGARGINLVPKEIIKETTEGRIFLTAAANDQSAFDYPDQKHGLFTHFLLDALTGSGDSDPETGNNDGWVSAYEVFNFVKERVSKTARKLENVKQEPQMVGTGDIKLTRTFQRKGGAMSQEDKIKKMKKAFADGTINMDQYVKAVGEIKSGNESQILKDYLTGKIDTNKFKDSYQ